MSSLGQWLIARKAEYVIAITSAYNNRDTTGALQNAWIDMISAEAISSYLPPGSTAFWKGADGNGAATGGGLEITAFQNYLADSSNSIHVASLGLTVQTAIDTGDRNNFGTSATGARYRRWKGQPLYTYGNGLMVGKENKVIALFGDHAPEISSGFGTDGLIYFDGIRFSKGTTTPGVVVFGGDIVVSGSIQGSGGIVIIDDVIQLETGVSNPAGIALNDSGKILLRHRGKGFLDFVDEDEKIYTGSVEASKFWVGAQNTSSTRLGSSLIPNGNFETIESYSASGTYSERPAGPIIIGNITKGNITIPVGQAGILQYYDGSDSNLGVLLPAIAIQSSKYTAKIRFSSEAAKSGGDTSNGLFVEVHEYSTDDIVAKSHVYHNGTTLGVEHEGYNSSGPTWSATVQQASSKVSLTSGGNGLNLGGSGVWNTFTFTYIPTAGTKFASLAVYSLNTPTKVYLDYVIMNPVTIDTSAANALITTANTAITVESENDSLVKNSSFETNPSAGVFTNWVKYGSSTLANAEGDVADDKACKVTAPGSLTGTGDGLLSRAVAKQSDKYTVGIRVRPVGSNGDNISVKIKAFEAHGPASQWADTKLYVGPSGTSDIVAANNTITLTSAKVDAAGNNTDAGLSTQVLTVSGTPANDWITLMGTYSVTYATVSGTDNPPTSSVQRFSLGIEVISTNGNVIVDYVYLAQQSSSIDLATELANQAYGDSQIYVSEMNQLVAQEQGSLISNAAMGAQEFVIPSTGGSAKTQARPAGFRYIGADHPYRLSYAPTSASLGKDAVMKVDIQATGHGVVTPPFALGSSDKFSIIIRARAVTGSVDVNVNVNYSTSTLNYDRVTIADLTLDNDGDDDNDSGTLVIEKGQGTNPGDDVLTDGTVGNKALAIDPGDGQGGSAGTVYDWNIGTNWENISVTWDRGNSDSNLLASLTIRSIGSNVGAFYIDYILVIPQTVSYSLADGQSIARREEAISTVNGYIEGINNNLAQESGSDMPNAAFANYVTIGSVIRPAGYYGTRGTNTINRVTTGVGAFGNALSFYPSVATDEGYGLLCPAIQLQIPIGPTGGSTPSSNGKYTFVTRIRSSAAEPISVKIIAHEFFGGIPAGKTHVISNSGSPAIEDSSIMHAYTESANVGVSQNLPIINITNVEDIAAGHSGNPYEVIPVDMSGEDAEGAADGVGIGDEFTDWYDLGGTYTANAKTRFVCFEIVINSDVDNDNTRAYPILDFIYFAAQTFDADFANTLATARTEEVIDNLEDNPAQVGELMGNPLFVSANKSQLAGYPKKWMPWEYESNAPYSILSFANNTLKRGMKISGSSGTTAGVISQPFRTSSDDYEIKVRAKMDTGDNTRLWVRVIEYSADISDTVEAIAIQESDIPTAKTVVGGHVVLGNIGDGYITLVKQGTNETYQNLTNAYQTFTYEYVPSATCRYASVLVRSQELDSDKYLYLSFIKCSVDNTATGNRLFSPFRGKTLSQLDLSGFGDSTGLKTAIIDNTNKSSFPGFGAAGLATALGNLSGDDFPSALRNSQITLTKSGGTFEFNGTSLGALTAANVGARGTSWNPSYNSVAVQSAGGKSGVGAAYVVDFDDIGGFANENRLLRTKASGGSGTWGRFSLSVSNNAKVMDEANIIVTDDDMEIPGYLTIGGGTNAITGQDGAISIRQASDNAASIYLFEHGNDTSDWSIAFDSSQNLDFRYDGNTKAWFQNSGDSYRRLNVSGDPADRVTAGQDVGNYQINFTGQHRCIVSEDQTSNFQEDFGLIVVSTGKYHNFESDQFIDKPNISNALPIVTLSTERNQKSCFGVVADEEELPGGKRTYTIGNLGFSYDTHEKEGDRYCINSLGEGAIWICNINGDLENGDYITTCEIPGLGMKQDDDILHNYTVAKITQDCNFRKNAKNYTVIEFEHEGQTYRKAFVGCTYHCG